MNNYSILALALVSVLSGGLAGKVMAKNETAIIMPAETAAATKVALNTTPAQAKPGNIVLAQNDVTDDTTYGDDSSTTDDTYDTNEQMEDEHSDDGYDADSAGKTDAELYDSNSSGDVDEPDQTESNDTDE